VKSERCGSIPSATCRTAHTWPSSIATTGTAKPTATAWSCACCAIRSRSRVEPATIRRNRLITTLIDHQLDPAKTLIELYHVRWEQELAIDELKTHQSAQPSMSGPMLRSQTPGGVVQELYGLLLDHYVIRKLMFEAAARLTPPRLTPPGLTPPGLTRPGLTRPGLTRQSRRMRHHWPLRRPASHRGDLICWHAENPALSDSALSRQRTARLQWYQALIGGNRNRTAAAAPATASIPA